MKNTVLTTRTPKLRFPQFKNAPHFDGDTVHEPTPEYNGKKYNANESSEWEEKKLGGVCKFVRGPFGGALKKEIFVKEGYAVYEQQHAIYQDFSFIRYFIDSNKYKELKRFAVTVDDIIMSCSGTMGKLALVPQDFQEGVINQALLKLSVDKNNNVSFIKIILELPQNQKQILSQAGGGAIKNVASVDELKIISLILPTLPEQQKIADCLSSLDELLALHTKKLELLKQHKKALMQQLFPQENETVPQLRFAGFSEDWEEKKLGEVGIFLRGHTYSANNVCEKGLLVLRSTNIQNNNLIMTKDLVFVNNECTNNQLLQKGDIVICMSNGSKLLVGKNAEFKSDYYNPVTIGAFCSLFRPKNAFAKFIFQTEKYEEYVALSIGGGNINNLKNSDLEEFSLLIPKDSAEQQKIADCLSSLDEFITSQSQKIATLKLHKKGLLQGLFVGGVAE